MLVPAWGLGRNGGESVAVAKRVEEVGNGYKDI